MKLVHLFCLLLACAWFLTGCATPQPAQNNHGHAPKPEELKHLIEAIAQLAATRPHTLLPESYIRATLNDRDQDAAIKLAFAQALPLGSCEAKLALLRAVELKFIHDPKTSGLDVLDSELSKHFREFAWQENDFPGGAEGPNEQFADVMVDALDLVRPERRANSTRDAVVLRAEATEVAWDYITNQWLSVPAQERWKLNRHALESFVRMREQAKAEGVDLIILSAHRHPQTAQRNAARELAQEKAGNLLGVGENEQATRSKGHRLLSGCTANYAE